MNCETAKVFSDGDLKLAAGSSSSGRLEIYHDGQWGTVCDDTFDSNNNGASVACRQLGFASGTVMPSFTAPYGSGQIWLRNVGCSGLESTLTECTHDGWGVYVNFCSHSEDVGVVCSEDPCSPSLCLNGATCSSGGGTVGFTCTCATGYTGQLCDGE
ncbi:galectin-3-binding protein A-like [Amphiura filiformis]|uniref:galectin-3-binding protein A-like n=1 Tax=Amphiura filiformis TaxID=82378 RepID=UPI003B2253E0